MVRRGSSLFTSGKASLIITGDRSRKPNALSFRPGKGIPLGGRRENTRRRQVEG